MFKTHLTPCSSIPHPYLNHESDAMLIVKDLEKGWEKNHEPTTEFYTELLAKKGVMGAFEVRPLVQFWIISRGTLIYSCRFYHSGN